MIISHEKKFIFIRNGKVASTSISYSLTEHCGPHDVITPTPEDKKYGIVPQHYKGFRKHGSILQAKRKSNKELFDTYFKFCFERNPWDKFVSHFYYMCREGKPQMEPTPENLNAYVTEKHIDFLKSFSGWRLYTIKDKIVVDRVFKYEKMDKAFKELEKRLGVKLKQYHVKTNYRPDRKHYRELLNDDSRRLIEKHFKKEIKAFGYSF